MEILQAVLLAVVGLWIGTADVRRRLRLLRRRDALLATTDRPRLRNQIRAQYRAEVAALHATSPGARWFLGIGGRRMFDPRYTR